VDGKPSPSARWTAPGWPMKLRKEETRDVSASANAADEILRRGTQSGRYALAYVDCVEVIERHRFVDVAREAAQWAELLRRHQLQHGSRVIVLAGRDRHWRSALLGVLQAGGVAVPCPASTSPGDFRFLASEGRAIGVVSASPRPELVEPLGMPVLWPGDLDAHQTRHGMAVRGHDATPDDFGLILYERDGAALRGEAHTHGSLLDRASASAHALGIQRGGTFWCTTPEGSAGSVLLTLAAWYAGVELVVVETELAPNSKLELVHRLPGGTIWFSDDEYAALAAAHVPSWVDLTHVGHALTHGEPAEGAIAFQDAFGVPAVPAAVTVDAANAAIAPAPAADAVPPAVASTFRDVGSPSREGDADLLRERAAREAAEEERRREDQQAKEQAEQRRRAEEAARAEEQHRLEEERRVEEERVHAEKDARRRDEQQARERKKEEERRRKEEIKQRELAETAARVEEQRRAEEQKRREEERLRVERDARRREEQQAKEQAKQRKLAEKAARVEEKRREEERLRAENDARRRDEQQAKERRRQEEQRRKEDAKQRELSEKAARAEENRRREEEKRHAEEEQRRRREEAKSRARAEREAEQALRRAEDAERAASVAAAARKPGAEEDAKGGARRARGDAESAQAEGLAPEVLSMLGQYGVTTTVRDRNGDDGADARTEPERARTPDERRETR
jgi:hypothetical protein